MRPDVAVLPADGTTTAVTLLLHGGKASSVAPSQRTNLSSVRMMPFARAIHAQGAARGVAVWRLRYRLRGWNGEDRSPVTDARWALDEVRRRHGDVPVVLVGHSMGGRTAVHVLDDPSVTAMVALASRRRGPLAEGLRRTTCSQRCRTPTLRNRYLLGAGAPR